MKKSISVLIMFAIIGSFTFSIPQKSQAVIPVAATIIHDAYDMSKKMVEAAQKAAVRMLVQQITQDLVNWIDSGFDGNPAFIQNPSGFLGAVTDQTIGEFIFNNKDLQFLCDPFKIKIQLALGLQYQPFRQQINCTLSDIIGNTEDAFNEFANGDFINGGGWDTWFKVTSNPANNPQGAFLIAKSELDARIESTKQSTEREAGWGNGALSLQNCVDTEYDFTYDENGNETKVEIGRREYVGNPFYTDDDYLQQNEDNWAVARDMSDGSHFQAVETDCNVTTPGTIITQKLGYSQTSDQRMTEYYAIFADAFDAVAAALANQVGKMALAQGKGLLGLDNKGEQDDYKAKFEEAMKNLDAVRGGSSSYNGGNDNGGGVNFDRTSAIEKINTQIETENTYRDVRQASYDLFAQTRDSFRQSVACINSSNSNEAMARTGIDGTITKALTELQTGGTDISDLMINETSINMATLSYDIAQAGINIKSLGNKKVAVNKAVSQSEIDSHISDIDAAPYHQGSDIKKTKFEEDTESWLRSLITSYASPEKICSFDYGVWTIVR